MAAAYEGKTDVAIELVKFKADVNHRNRVRNTPLLAAASTGSTDIIIALVKTKANIDHKNQYGYDAMRWAREKNRSDLISMLEKAKKDFEGFCVTYMTQGEKQKAEKERLAMELAKQKAKQKAEAEQLAEIERQKAEAERLRKQKDAAELRKWFADASIDLKIVPVVTGEGVTCVQDMAEFTEEDLDLLNKMAGLNLLHRRRLITAVKELRKPPVPAASSSVGVAAAASDPKAETESTTSDA